jgi:hypothetical protein
MAYDYSSLVVSTANLIQKFGTAVTIQSASTGKTVKTYAVYCGGTDASDTTNTTSLFTKITTGTETCYLPATVIAPLPGDIIIGKNRSHKILTIQSYSPADTLIAYKVALQ